MAKSDVMEQPNNAAEAPTQRGRPKKTETKQPKDAAGRFESPPKLKTFWERQREIRPEDWGPRFAVYLYRIEPVIDRLRSAENKYLRVYSEPVTEEQIMVEFGSGKYRAMLVSKKPGQETGETNDSFVFEILNLKHPPAIPKGEWVDDPRNKRWSWAKEPDPPLKPGLAEVSEAFDTFNEMQDKIRQQIGGGQQGNPTSQFKDMAEAVSKIVEIAKPPVQAETAKVDPFELATRILQIRSDNPMVELMKEQMTAIREELKEQRQEAARLQRELFDVRTKKDETEEGSKGFAGKIKELVEVKNEVKDLLGISESTGRRGTPAILELVKETVIQLAGSPVVAAIISRMAGPAPGPMPGMGQSPAVHQASPPAANGTSQPQRPEPDAQAFMQFVQQITPVMISKLEAGQSGGDFAGWMYEGYPDTLPKLQTLTHASLPGLQGAPVIIAFYRTTPYWPRIMQHEQGFTKFIEEFCAWRAETAEAANQEADDPGDEGEKPERMDL